MGRGQDIMVATRFQKEQHMCCPQSTAVSYSSLITYLNMYEFVCMYNTFEAQIFLFTFALSLDDNKAIEKQ